MSESHPVHEQIRCCEHLEQIWIVSHLILAPSLCWALFWVWDLRLLINHAFLEHFPRCRLHPSWCYLEQYWDVEATLKIIIPIIIFLFNNGQKKTPETMDTCLSQRIIFCSIHILSESSWKLILWQKWRKPPLVHLNFITHVGCQFKVEDQTHLTLIHTPFSDLLG